ncbi:MAG: phage holin family protein [Bacteroidales bacterium]|nr:phage holin family protein [Bacteroidales bacterium]
MEQLKGIYEGIVSNWLAGLVVGFLAYLIQPTAAFYALWVAVGLDLLTKIVALSYGSGGFIRAIKCQNLNSHTMFRKAFVKILAYFTLTVVAYQSKYIIAIEAVPILFSTIIYSILFLVEVHSIIENLIAAGCDDLKPLLMRFDNEKKRAIEGTGSIVSDICATKSTETDQPIQGGEPPL